MKTYDKLRKEALESCRFRGHKMLRFKKYGAYKDKGHSICEKCAKSVWIDCAPPPNGIDVSGEAVALGCIR